MNDSIIIAVTATLDDDGITLHSMDWGEDASGWVLELPQNASTTVVLRLFGADAESQARLAGVRSVPTPDLGQGPWTDWTSIGDDYVSPVLALGDAIRIEVSDSGAAAAGPRGGGHFRVVEMGGGFVLAPTHADDRDALRTQAWTA